MSNVVFVDLESISLQRTYRHIWEIALLGDDFEFVRYPDVPLEEADPIALNIGRFHERHPRQGVLTTKQYRDDHAHQSEYAGRLEEWAAKIVALTAGKHLVGAVPSFDEQRLWDFCRAHGQTPTWHYHLVDVEALAAGWLAGAGLEYRLIATPPWDSNDLSRAVGVDPDDFDRHTALGDCYWSRAIWEAVFG